MILHHLTQVTPHISPTTQIGAIVASHKLFTSSGWTCFSTRSTSHRPFEPVWLKSQVQSFSKSVYLKSSPPKSYLPLSVRNFSSSIRQPNHLSIGCVSFLHPTPSWNYTSTDPNSKSISRRETSSSSSSTSKSNISSKKSDVENDNRILKHLQLNAERESEKRKAEKENESLSAVSSVPDILEPQLTPPPKISLPSTINSLVLKPAKRHTFKRSHASDEERKSDITAAPAPISTVEKSRFESTDQISRIMDGNSRPKSKLKVKFIDGDAGVGKTAFGTSRYQKKGPDEDLSCHSFSGLADDSLLKALLSGNSESSSSMKNSDDSDLLQEKSARRREVSNRIEQVLIKHSIVWPRLNKLLLKDLVEVYEAKDELSNLREAWREKQDKNFIREVPLENSKTVPIKESQRNSTSIKATKYQSVKEQQDTTQANAAKAVRNASVWKAS